MSIRWLFVALIVIGQKAEGHIKPQQVRQKEVWSDRILSKEWVKFVDVLKAAFSKLQFQSDHFYRNIENVIYRPLIAVIGPGDSEQKHRTHLEKINKTSSSVFPIFSGMFIQKHHWLMDSISFCKSSVLNLFEIPQTVNKNRLHTINSLL